MKRKKIWIYNFSKRKRKWKKIEKKSKKKYQFFLRKKTFFGLESADESDYILVILNKKSNLKFIFEVIKKTNKKTLIISEKKLNDYSNFQENNNKQISFLFFENRVSKNFFHIFLPNFLKNKSFENQNFYIFHNEPKDLCKNCLELILEEKIDYKNPCKKNYFGFKEREVF